MEYNFWINTKLQIGFSDELAMIAKFLKPGLWISETAVEVTLALNRCLQFGLPQLAALIFGSEKGKGIWQTYVLLTLIGGYGIFYTIFGIPVVFSASIKHFIWEPHLLYDKTLIPKVLFTKKNCTKVMYDIVYYLPV